jgi:hypothetical protein
MALQVRRNSSAKVRIITTLIAVFALVAQPLYGFISVSAQTGAANNPGSANTDIIINNLTPNDNENVLLRSEDLFVAEVSTRGSIHDIPNFSVDTQGGYFTVDPNKVGLTSKVYHSMKGAAGEAENGKVTGFFSASPTAAEIMLDTGMSLGDKFTLTASIANGSKIESLSSDNVHLGESPAPVIVAENFNTNSDSAYDGISVGFNVKGFEAVKSVTVKLIRADGSVVTKTAGPAVLSAINDDGKETLSTPFIIKAGTFTESNDKDSQGSLYWNPASATQWTSATRPTNAIVEIVSGDNANTIVNADNVNTIVDNDTTLDNDKTTLHVLDFNAVGKTFTEPDGVTYESIAPTHPPVQVDSIAPTINSLKVTNPSLWGDSYNLLTIPNHVSTASGFPTVGGSLNVSANFADNMVLTNVISLLPGRGFFADNETSPFPANNGTWNPVAQGQYSVAWNTKTGVDWRAVPDGNYSFTFQARDGGNGQNKPQNSTTLPIDLTVDNTAPSVSFMGATPAEGETVKGNIIVEGNFSDANGLMNTDIGVHGISWYCHTDWPVAGVKSCAIDTTKLTDGTHHLTMNVRDKAGNTTQVFRTIKVDNTAPSVPVNGAPHNAYELDNDFYFTWANSTDVSSSPVTYEFQSSLNPAQSNGELTADLWRSDTLNEAKIHSTGAPDGVWYWQVRAIDAVGNKSAWSAVWNMTIDHVAPVVSLTSPADNATLRGASLTQSWASIDSDINHYEYVSYNDSAMTQIRFSQNMGLQTSKTATNVGNATFWWRVKAVDNAGHETWSELRKVTIDNNKPTATILFNAIGDTFFKVKFNENVNKDDAENAANYFLENWPGAGGSGDLAGDATVVYDPATMTAKVTFADVNWSISAEQKWGVRNVRDLAGNNMDETVAYSTPLIKPIVSNVQSETVGKNITWIWAGNDPAGNNGSVSGASGVQKYEYRLQQGADVVRDWTSVDSATSVTTAVADDGVYELYVRVQDKAGNLSNEAMGSATVDTEAPTLTLNTPVQNSDGTYRVTGTTSDSSIPVVVTVDGVALEGSVVVDENGSWAADLGELNAGISYAIAVNSKDAHGNEAVQRIVTFVVPPVVVTPALSLATVLPSLSLPASLSRPAVSVASNFTTGTVARQEAAAQNTAVLGTQDKKAETPLANTAAITPSSEGWKIFSMAWYWWLLIVIGAMALWMWIAAGIRRIRATDSL